MVSRPVICYWTSAPQAYPFISYAVSTPWGDPDFLVTGAKQKARTRGQPSMCGRRVTSFAQVGWAADGVATAGAWGGGFCYPVPPLEPPMFNTSLHWVPFPCFSDARCRVNEYVSYASLWFSCLIWKKVGVIGCRDRACAGIQRWIRGVAQTWCILTNY